MEEHLNESIKLFNLMFTDTIDRYHFCRVGFNLNNQIVKYDNCISLNDIKESFRITYNAFKKEYDELEKLNLGEYIEVDGYTESEYMGDKYHTLMVYIEKPTMIDKPYTYLYINEINGIMEPAITNIGINYDEEDYRINIHLDEDICRKYLALFKKYAPLLETHEFFKNNWNYGDGTFCLFSKIHSKRDNILNDLEDMEFTLGSNYFMSPGDHMMITISLKDNKIDLSKSYLDLDDHLLEADSSLYERILNEIYLNKSHIQNSPYRKYHYSFDDFLELKKTIENEEVKVLKKIR